jgi:hypothetical protein
MQKREASMCASHVGLEVDVELTIDARIQIANRATHGGVDPSREPAVEAV